MTERPEDESVETEDDGKARGRINEDHSWHSNVKQEEPPQTKQSRKNEKAERGSQSNSMLPRENAPVLYQ